MSTKCSQCGFENPLGVNVCGNCAAPLARACASCGFENPGNFKFCGNCGTNLLSASPARGTRAESRQLIANPMPAALAEKIATAGKQIEGERRTVTVLFADITGFTTISEKLDPEEVYHLIDSTLKAFIEEIYKHEGTLDKIIGDGLMALFGAPVAHEDDPARAARTALGMQAALRRVNEDLEARLGISLKIRIGLNSGLVVVGSIGSDLRMDYTALGDTVNVASRLQSVAEPGTILASRSVYEQTKPLFEYRELGSIRVKGRVEPVEIFELTAVKAKAGRVRGISGLNAPMVGREEELARLRQVVNDLIREGQGRSVLVTGEAGLGKSRLTTEFKSYLADKRVTLLEGACLSYGQSAYGVFLRLLRSYFDIAEDNSEDIIRNKIEYGVRAVLSESQAVSDVLPYIENLFSIKIVEKELAERVRHLEPAQLQQQTFLAVRDLMRAEATHRPLILIFEDVHWIDKLSLDLLSFLLGSIEQFPIVLYCNSRPAEGAAAPTLRQIGDDLYASRFVYLPLAPLTQADSVALIDLLLSIADLPENLKQMIPQRAEGNPFYLEEIIRVLIDRGVIQRVEGHWRMTPDADIANLEVPRTLQGLIMTRVDHLGETARQAVQSAAVIGREFPFKLLTVVLDGMRSLQEDVSELEDREIVNRILEAAELEYRFHHVLIQETVYNSLLIRRRERLHQKIAEGIELLFKDRLEEQVERLAYHYSESKDLQRALPYLIRGGKRAADRFANDEALRAYRLAADFLTKVTPTIEQRIDVYSGLAQVQSFVGDYDGALNSYLVALELIRTSPSSSSAHTSAEFMRRIGRVHERRGDYTESMRWLENALREIDRDAQSGKAVERVRIYNDIGWVHYRRGQFEEAYQWRMRSLQIVEGTDHYNEMASVYNGLCVLFRENGDWARSTAYAEKGLRLRETIGDAKGVSNSHTNLGVIAIEQCQWDDAMYHYARSLKIKEKIGDIEGIALLTNNLGVPFREKGEFVRAIELFESALLIAQRIKNRNVACYALNNLAQVHLVQGNFTSAISYLQQSIVLANEMGSKEHLAEAQWLAAESHIGLGDLAKADSFAQNALEIASEIGKRLIEGQVLRTLGKIEHAERNLPATEDFLKRSITIFTELKNPFELAKSQFHYALLQRERGQVTEARATLETAYATFARLGAEAERQRTRAELDRVASGVAAN